MIDFTSIENIALLLGAVGFLASVSLAVFAYLRLRADQRAERRLHQLTVERDQLKLLLSGLAALGNRNVELATLAALGPTEIEDWADVMIAHLTRNPPDPVLLKLGEALVETAAGSLPARDRARISEPLRQASSRGRADYIIKLLEDGLLTGTPSWKASIEADDSYESRDTPDPVQAQKEAGEARQGSASPSGHASKNEGPTLARPEIADEEYIETRQRLQTAAETSPSNSQALVEWARLERDRGDMEMARRLFQTAAETSRHSMDAWNGLAALLEHEGRFAESIEAYHHALEARPNSADAWLGLAGVLSRQGRLDEAMDAYKRSQAISQRGNFSLRMD